MEALDKLIEAVEAGTATDFDPAWPCVYHAKMAYEGHLDAAKLLHEALLPGWDWGRTEGNIYVKDPTRGSRSTRWGGLSDNPARSWLLAILKAYRSTL